MLTYLAYTKPKVRFLVPQKQGVVVQDSGQRQGMIGE